MRISKNLHDFCNRPSGVLVFLIFVIVFGRDEIALCQATCVHEGIRISITITPIPTATTTNPGSSSREVPAAQGSSSNTSSCEHIRVWLCFCTPMAMTPRRARVFSKNTLCYERLSCLLHYPSRFGHFISVTFPLCNK